MRLGVCVFLIILFYGVMLGHTATTSSFSRSIHVEWGYTPPSEPQVSGYRLYQEGVKACQTTTATATAMDCRVTLVKAVTNFTLTATFADGTESPHSAPFAFSLDDTTTQTPGGTTPLTSTPPTAVLATSVAAGTSPLTVRFDGSKSTAGSGKTLASYQWQFGDNGSGNGSSVTHTYTQAGTFTATLTVTDSKGLKNSASTPIIVSKPAAANVSTSVKTQKASTSTSIGTTSISTTSTTSTAASVASALHLEAGEIAVTSDWRKVSFASNYQQPIVVTGPLSKNDQAPVTVRLRNVTGTGFEIRLIQWPYQRTAHGTETISYLVLEQGRHTLADGRRIEAGQLTGSTGKSTVSLKSSFINTPMVFTAITSCNDTEAISGRVLSVAKTGFSYIFQMQERNRSLSHSAEKVHYVAWEPGVGQIGTARYETAVPTQIFTSAWKAVALQSTFKKAPLLFAEMQSSNGLNPAVLRVQQTTAKGFQILIQEEQSLDREMFHTAEKIGYLAIDPIDFEQ